MRHGISNIASEVPASVVAAERDRARGACGHDGELRARASHIIYSSYKSHTDHDHK